MDKIGSILDSKDFREPDEILKLKEYVKSAYSSDINVSSGPKGLTIIAGSSALASTLRLKLPEIKRQLKINQKVNIRIG